MCTCVLIWLRHRTTEWLTGKYASTGMWWQGTPTDLPQPSVAARWEEKPTRGPTVYQCHSTVAGHANLHASHFLELPRGVMPVSILVLCQGCYVAVWAHLFKR